MMRLASLLAVLWALLGPAAYAWPAHLAVAGGGRPAPTTIYANGNVSLTPSGAATVNTTGGCAAGKTAIAEAGGFNGQGVASITDSKGNTWTLITDNFFGSGGNLYGSVWKSTLSNSLVAVTDTLTLTYGTSSATQGFVIFDCIGTLAADATGSGNVGGTSTAPTFTDVSTMASPPTAAARVFMVLSDFGDFSGVTVSDPSGPGWTLADTALDTADFGFKLYYQDVSAGASSTLRWTQTGSATVSWGAWWASFD